MAQLAEAEFCFAVSPLLCFLPNSDGLSDDDDPRLAGGQLELLRSMPNVASVMYSPPYLSTPCPLHGFTAGSHLGWEEERP